MLSRSKPTGSWSALKRPTGSRNAIPVAQALVLHRFTDFSVSQEALIRAYGARGSVVVTVTYEPDSDATAAAASLIERMGPAERTHVPSEAFDTDGDTRSSSRAACSQRHPSSNRATP